jgi:hypothetical protein
MRAVIAFFVLLVAAAHISAASAQPWRITRTHWSAADERGFGKFVAKIGESDCSSSESCLRDPANPYRATDGHFVDIDVDCAKWPYLLRAYYAWKNGLPFSYVDGVSGEGGDLRYDKNGNHVTGRRDLIDHGRGIDGPLAIRTMLSEVYSGTYRTDATQTHGILSDFYSPALAPGSIRPGTIVYDVNGHVGIVYKVDSDGRAFYMDAHPDFSVSRSVYGAQFGQSPARLGGGFKNWRPFKLVGAHRDGAGYLIGGRMVYAQNNQIPDFSLVQYTGTEGGSPEDPTAARFVYNGQSLGFYEYARVAVSGGKVDFNPIYELKITMQTMCNDLNDRAQFIGQSIAEGIQNRPHPARLPDNIYGSNNADWESYSTPSRDARIKAEAAAFYQDMAKMIRLWIDRDPRIVYDGQFLKADLQKAYDKASNACVITYLNSAKHPVSMTLDDMIHRLYKMSFDPYDCVELRWGASGDEAQTCTDDSNKLRWYAAEQRLRNQIVPEYNRPMNFTVEDLERHRPGAGVDDPPPVDVKAEIENMGPQVAFQGMTPVGR